VFAQSIEAVGGKAVALLADLTQEPEAERAIACRRSVPSLDILVANPHLLLQRGRIVDCSLMVWQQASAKEVGPFGIRVNSGAPRLMATQFHDRFSIAGGRPAAVAHMLLGRERQPEDVVGAALFLVSPHAAFITGETIEVNGEKGLV
jgi:NAD(P)-dependent dehydrogenase (short-subunit alcohol dehydrogenase family)